MHVKYVLDIRDLSADPISSRWVKDVDVIVNDPEISVVCETMGGATFAYEYTKKALEKGISVCTSNKELVEAKGAELMEMANGCVVERYIIPDEDKQKVLDTLFPFFEKPSLDDERLDIHCHKKFKVRDFMVTHEGDGNFIVSPYYAEAGGTVLDWVKFDDIAHYCGVSVNTLRK